MRFFSEWKNVILAVVLLSLTAGMALPVINSIGTGRLFETKKAQAQWVTVGDVPRWIQWAIDKIQQYWKDYLYPALRDLASKKIMDYITQQTLNWINNGTEPTFVGNWNQFMNDAGNIAFNSVNSYLNTAGLDLCSPFAPQVQILLKGAYMGSQLPVRCSIDNFRQNISNSLNLVKNGGWISYTQAFMPEGNLIGMYVTAENSLIAKATTQEAARVNEAISSSGFLGQKTCAKYADGYSADIISQNCSTDSDPSTCIAYATRANCVSWDVKTPGDVAAKAVANAITSDTQWGANIQNFVSVVINALINKIFQRGLSSLSSNSGTSDITTTSNDSSNSQFNDVRQQIATYYEDTIYYLNSTEYPTIQTWQDVQNLAQEGVNSCSPPDEWQIKSRDVSTIIGGLQAMLNQAQTNLDELNSIDPSSMTSNELNQKIQEVTTKFDTFHTAYQAILDNDIEKAKQLGDITDTEKTAIVERNSLTAALSTAPACGSPDATSTQ